MPAGLLGLRCPVQLTRKATTLDARVPIPRDRVLPWDAVDALCDRLRQLREARAPHAAVPRDLAEAEIDLSKGCSAGIVEVPARQAVVSCGSVQTRVRACLQ